MRKTASKAVLHVSAFDQANILVEYLRDTATEDLDLEFVNAHADALTEFAREAKLAASSGKAPKPQDAGRGAEARRKNTPDNGAA